ncbi:MAG TPA: DUF3891 family protein [Thermoanaerobaculales bacterium]|nr:DUF3891 family protein [Thermoanaerobaculales bacterium]HPA80236.1 DUF3891 family protein [Thermoanaerobaculales bacterium]HQN97414.1 DUF3891 family protein [Thermoanaerobaculales bacterium]
MFLYDEGDASGTLAIPQASHAWLAWQVAEHWGNRRFARPAPRAEVLAAVLLHDSGWTEFDVDPGVDGDARPVTFDRMPVAAHVDIWRSSVHRAAALSRYAALLVAHHFAALVEGKTADLLDRGDTAGGRAAQAFRAELERLQDGWREALCQDARYQPFLDGEGWLVNSGVLEACDRVSVYLCASLGSPFTVTGPTPDGGRESICFERAEGRRWRVRPWPLEGDRLRVQVEGRRLARKRFGSAEELRQSLSRAPVERLSFELVRPSAG